MNEVDTERDCAVVEEEEESFKAKAVNEVDAERDRATPQERGSGERI